MDEMQRFEVMTVVTDNGPGGALKIKLNPTNDRSLQPSILKSPEIDSLPFSGKKVLLEGKAPLWMYAHLAVRAAENGAIEKMIAEPERHNPEELLDMLILHGAVQAPFAIPMSASRKERHNSWTAGETNAPGFLETVLEEYSRKFDIGLSGGDLLNRLRQPLRTSSVLYGKAALLELARSNQAEDRQILECEIPELRDVPDLSREGMEKLRKKRLAEAEEIRSRREKTAALEAEIQEIKDNIAKNNAWREGLLKSTKLSFPEEAGTFKLWADYLQMKAEANEAHSICRGRALVYFAQIAFTVSLP